MSGQQKWTLSGFLNSFPTEFKVLSLVAMLQQLSVGAYQPLIPQLAVNLGVSGGSLGVLYAVSGMIPLLLALPIGAAIDNVGVRRVLFVGTITRSVGTLVLWIWPNVSMMLVSLILTATSFLLVEVAQQTYISGIGTGRDVERNFGWFTFIMGLGMVAGPYLGGVVADTWGYNIAFLGAGVAAVLALPGVYALREQEHSRVTMPERHPWTQSIGQLIKNRGIFTGVMTVGFLYFALGAWQIYLPAYLATLSYSPAQIGQVVSAFTLASMLARPLLSIGSDFFGRRLLATLCLAVTGVGLLAVPLSATIWILTAIGALIGSGRGLMPLLSIVLISDHSEPSNRGMALSFRMMVVRLGSTIYPLIFGAAAAVAGMQGPFFVAGSLALVSAGAVQRSKMFTFSRVDEPELRSPGNQNRNTTMEASTK